MSIYVISDIHGYYEALMKLLKLLPKDAKLCFVGDLIDRGPDGRKVVQFVMENKHDMCLGNHEDFMLYYSNDPDKGDIWLDRRNGGMDTIKSYQNHEKDYEKHCDWIETLPLYVEYPDIKNENGRSLIVSHSSIDYWELRNAMPDIFKENVLWTRSIPPAKEVPNKFNVFGHTSQDHIPIQDSWACIDGTFVGHWGKIRALKFPEMEIFEVDMRR